MLSTLILDNFKAFGRRQVIPLAPITLIFGANSAGKSSILQSLLLLKQTVAQAESNETLLLPKGDLVDLGSFREMVFAHDTGRVCEISPLLMPVEVAARWLSGYSRSSSPRPRAPLGIGFQFGFDASERALKLVSLPYYWGSANQPAYRLLPAEASQHPERASLRSRYEPSRVGLGSYSRFVRVGDLDASHPLWAELFREFMDRLRLQYVNRLRQAFDAVSETEKEPSRSRVLRHLLFFPNQETADGEVLRKRILDMQRFLKDRLQRLSNYDLPLFVEDTQAISSLRTIGLRNYLPDDASFSSAHANDLELTVRRLFEFDDPRALELTPDVVQLSLMLASSLRRVFENLVYLGPLREYPERHYIFSGNVAREVGKSGRLLPDLLFKQPQLVEKTNDVLKRFRIGYTLRIHRVNDPDVEDVFGLRLVDDRSGTTVSMLDVGFGISQVLPVIVQSMLSSRNVILIEQPEIHLHPRLQADLGSLFAQCISEPQRNQFIVETHSEHLILRLQGLIRKRVLKPSHISVIYVMKDEDGSRCYPLRLDDDGDFIDKWPEGFFEEGFRELFA